MKKLTLALLLALAACQTQKPRPGAPASTSASPPPGPTASVWNEVSKEYVPDYDRVWKACHAAVRTLMFGSIWDGLDKQVGLIRCLRADGSPVEIRVERLTGGGAKVAVRVGATGGPDFRVHAEGVHKQIRRELGLKTD